MPVDPVRRLRLRYLLAIGVTAPFACNEALPGAGASSAGVSASSASSASTEATSARAPELESKNLAPLPYAGNDCPMTMTRCMQGQPDAGYDGAFPECSPEYTGEYYARSRLSLHETTKARRKDPNICCYRVERPCNYDMPVIGRVLRDDAVARVAGTRSTDGWLPRPGIGALRVAPDEHRAALARHWAGEAAAEHASVAAFSLIALQLLAFAAPAALVEATHEAARDEIEHARMSFSIASFHAGADVGPAPLPIPSAHALSIPLETFALEALVDGCIGETVAALVARESAVRTTDPLVAAMLTRIADDEESHAELAFRTVRWALDRDAGLATPLRRALDQVALTGARDGVGALEPWGALGDDARAAVRDRALAGVVRPCLEAMLARRERPTGL